MSEEDDPLASWKAPSAAQLASRTTQSRSKRGRRRARQALIPPEGIAYEAYEALRAQLALGRGALARKLGFCPSAYNTWKDRGWVDARIIAFVRAMIEEG